MLEACRTYAPDDPKCACINTAIFTHESQWGTAGVGRNAFNPCAMRPAAQSPVAHAIYAVAGNGSFARFQDMPSGINACVELYARKYRGLSSSVILRGWAQTDNPAYHASLDSCF